MIIFLNQLTQQKYLHLDLIVYQLQLNAPSAYLETILWKI